MIYPVNYISISQGYHGGKSLDFGWWLEKYKGQDILSCANGVVYKVEKQKTGGNTIFIKHDDCYSCYGHLGSVVVKKSQKVKLGQKIGTMGSTGIVTGEHLHFGLYSKGKNLYGNADIDPFKVCLVYPKQKVRQTGTTKQYLSKFKYLDDKAIWEKGDYKLLYDKAVRKSHNLGLNIAKVKDLLPTTRKYLTSQKLNDNAYLKKGSECKISDIYDEKGRIWGKFGKFWIVLCNISGEAQADKMK